MWIRFGTQTVKVQVSTAHVFRKFRLWPWLNRMLAVMNGFGFIPCNAIGRDQFKTFIPLECKMLFKDVGYLMRISKILRFRTSSSQSEIRLILSLLPSSNTKVRVLVNRLFSCQTKSAELTSPVLSSCCNWTERYSKAAFSKLSNAWLLSLKLCSK